MIERELSDCEVLVAVIGKRWLTERLDNPEDYVRREIAFAFDHGALVVPVLVDSAEIPPTNDLPADIAELVKQQAMSLNNKSHAAYLDDVRRLIEVIENKLRGTPEEEGQVQAIRWFNWWLEIIVDPNEVTEIQIPYDSEVVSFGGLRMLGLDERSPGSGQWTWGAILERLRGEGNVTWLDDLTQSVYAACHGMVLRPILKRARSFDSNQAYIVNVNRVREEFEGRMSIEVIFVKDPGPE